MVTAICQWKGCAKHFQARQADINRGWGKFCSKACKAKEQECRTGQYRAHQSRENSGLTSAERMHNEAMADLERGWDGHKDIY